jgi:hypothetical protein
MALYLAAAANLHMRTNWDQQTRKSSWMHMSSRSIPGKQMLLQVQEQGVQQEQEGGGVGGSVLVRQQR